MKGFFVTGTDTGVGKTFVTCAVAQRARAAGLRVFAFKPIETGVSGEWGEDQVALADAAGDVRRGTYRFKLAAAPWVASQLEREEIDLDRVEAQFREGARGADLLLVEGAGGWRVPLTPKHDTSDLARRISLPVLVVARAGLGTINHTLLTVEAIRADGLEVAGVVLSLRPDEDAEFARSNAEQLLHRCGLSPSIYPALPLL
jgi:dethiobiotin synthetase